MFEQIVIENLLVIVAAYRKATGKSLTTISKEFYGRGDFIDCLRTGERGVLLGRVSEFLDWLRKNWPEDTDWPLTRPVFMSKVPPSK
jgi:hypothetical protein